MHGGHTIARRVGWWLALVVTGAAAEEPQYTPLEDPDLPPSRAVGGWTPLNQRPHLDGSEAELSGTVAAWDSTRGMLTVKVERVGRRGATTALPFPAGLTVLTGVYLPPPGLACEDGSPLPWSAVKPGRSVTVAVASTDDQLLPEVRRVQVTGTDAALAAGGRRWEPWYPTSYSQDQVVVPLTFPVIGDAPWHDTFLKTRGGLPGQHTGQDLSAPRMRPLVAAFDGQVFLRRADDPRRANSVLLVGDGGWQALYSHLNNDTPGTSDNRGLADYAFAPGLQNGTRVVAGQLVGWVGDSGFATGPHLHFELCPVTTGVGHNAAASLRAAKKVAAPRLRTVAPEVHARAGETRLEGAVRTIDPARGVVVVEVRSQVVGGGPPQAATQPRRAYVRCGPAPLPVIGAAGVTATLDEVPPGATLVALGPVKGGSLQARELHVEATGALLDPALRAVAGLGAP